MRQPSQRFFFLFIVGVAGLCTTIRAQSQEVTESGKQLEVQVETVLTGLFNPCGVAIRPGTTGDATEIFVADSGGLRVVKMVAGKPGEAVDVITGFPKSSFGDGPTYEIGPLGLAFLDNKTLVVGGGGLPVGEDRLNVYKLPDDGAALTADQMEHSVGPIAAGDQSKTGEGNFFGLAMSSRQKDALYSTSSGDEEKGWVLRAPISGGKLKSLAPSIETRTATNVGAPVGITFSPTNFLVVGQLGEISEAKDSLLTFYTPDSGELRLKLEAGLRDLVALAYSPAKEPKDSKLYALDFAWSASAEGGLFCLQATDPAKRDTGCYANKLASLDKPTAMAFTPNGILYATVFGTAEEGSEAKPGKLLKLTGKFSVVPAEAK